MKKHLTLFAAAVTLIGTLSAYAEERAPVDLPYLTNKKLIENDEIIAVYNGLTKNPAMETDCYLYGKFKSEKTQNCYISYGFLTIDYGGATVIYDPVSKKRLASIIAKNDALQIFGQPETIKTLKEIFPQEKH